MLLRSITKELLAPRVSNECGYPKQIQGIQWKRKMQKKTIKTKTKKKLKTSKSTNLQKCRLPPDSETRADSPGIGVTPRRPSGLSHSQVLRDPLA